MLIAITREPNPSIVECHLTFLHRQRIDFQKAVRQHRAYTERLAQLGVHVVRLAADSQLPDAAFVEDNAVVLEEVAVVAAMGLPSRLSEVKELLPTLSRYRPLKFLRPPATLEGGDVVCVGRTLYAGVSTRTNLEGVNQLSEILYPFDYEVRPVGVKGCLHLTTALSYVGENTILANKDWVDLSQFEGFNLIDASSIGEPWAANTIRVNGFNIASSSFPKTCAVLRGRGFNVATLDISELEKAEAGLSCLSLVFENKDTPSLQEATK